MPPIEKWNLRQEVAAVAAVVFRTQSHEEIDLQSDHAGSRESGVL